MYKISYRKVYASERKEIENIYNLNKFWSVNLGQKYEIWYGKSFFHIYV